MSTEADEQEKPTAAVQKEEDTPPHTPPTQQYNNKPLIRCDASYLGAALPTLTTQPPGIIYEPLEVICQKVVLPTSVEPPTKPVRLYVFHSAIVVEVLFGLNAGEYVWYPIQNLYCSAGLLPQRNEKNVLEFLALDMYTDDLGNLRPIFAMVMRETVHKKLLQCHAFSVVNRQAAQLLVQATALAFRAKTGWNHPILDENFSGLTYRYSLNGIDSASNKYSNPGHVTRINLSGDMSTSTSYDKKIKAKKTKSKASRTTSLPASGSETSHDNPSYVPSDSHPDFLIPSPSSASIGTGSSAARQQMSWTVGRRLQESLLSHPPHPLQPPQPIQSSSISPSADLRYIMTSQKQCPRQHLSYTLPNGHSNMPQNYYRNLNMLNGQVLYQHDVKDSQDYPLYYDPSYAIGDLSQMTLNKSNSLRPMSKLSPGELKHSPRYKTCRLQDTNYPESSKMKNGHSQVDAREIDTGLAPVYHPDQLMYGGREADDQISSHAVFPPGEPTLLIKTPKTCSHSANYLVTSLTSSTQQQR